MRSPLHGVLCYYLMRRGGTLYKSRNKRARLSLATWKILHANPSLLGPHPVRAPLLYRYGGVPARLPSVLVCNRAVRPPLCTY